MSEMVDSNVSRDSCLSGSAFGFFLVPVARCLVAGAFFFGSLFVTGSRTSCARGTAVVVSSASLTLLSTGRRCRVEADFLLLDEGERLDLLLLLDTVGISTLVEVTDSCLFFLEEGVRLGLLLLLGAVGVSVVVE